MANFLLLPLVKPRTYFCHLTFEKNSSGPMHNCWALGPILPKDGLGHVSMVAPIFFAPDYKYLASKTNKCFYIQKKNPKIDQNIYIFNSTKSL